MLARVPREGNSPTGLAGMLCKSVGRFLKQQKQTEADLSWDVAAPWLGTHPKGMTPARGRATHTPMPMASHAPSDKSLTSSSTNLLLHGKDKIRAEFLRAQSFLRPIWTYLCAMYASVYTDLLGHTGEVF